MPKYIWHKLTVAGTVQELTNYELLKIVNLKSQIVAPDSLLIDAVVPNLCRDLIIVSQNSFNDIVKPKFMAKINNLLFNFIEKVNNLTFEFEN